MNSTALYVLTVLIWGSTWIAIKYQLGDVALVVSIAHRFALSAALIWVFLWLKKENCRLSAKTHLLVMMQGICLFSMNYVLIYNGSKVLTSGLVAVVFSSMAFLNPINSAIFLKQPLQRRVIIGAVVGVAGMIGVFLPELQSVEMSSEVLVALLFCFSAVCLASFGNMFAAYNQTHGQSVLVCMAWGMVYGAVLMYLIALIMGESIRLSLDFPYLASLVYLALFGSVIAFWAYISLMGKIGVDKAAYTTLMFPMVALAISTVFEDYRWTLVAAVGFCLVLLGNWLVMGKSKV